MLAPRRPKANRESERNDKQVGQPSARVKKALGKDTNSLGAGTHRNQFCWARHDPESSNDFALDIGSGFFFGSARDVPAIGLGFGLQSFEQLTRKFLGIDIFLSLRLLRNGRIARLDGKDSSLVRLEHIKLK